MQERFDLARELLREVLQLRAEPRFVARAHARGHRVYVWTVDDPADVDYVLDLGVDTIITNRPDVAVRELAAGS